ncbi:MAG: shikimate dehydrogenase, partial [Acidimicrobiia bacterium]|nr:shikimate dehydrogenase [Acidimicrobiia bacterium]
AVELAGPVGALADANSLREVDLIVNATPVGMFDNDEDPTAVPFDPAIIRPGQIVADLIYHPPETALLAAARERGATVINGVGMLLHQAAEAFELWTGTQAPIEVMREALLGSLDDERT